MAQSDGGLKLGQPATEDTAPKLDLGAPAPADRPTESAPAAPSSPLHPWRQAQLAIRV